MNPLVTVAAGAGAIILGYSIFKPKKAYAGEAEEGLRLRKGEQALITARLSPITADQWQKVATNAGMMATISANVFPQDGPLSVDSFTPAPSPGVFSVVVTAKKATLFKPSVGQIGEYTVTTVASRKV